MKNTNQKRKLLLIIIAFFAIFIVKAQSQKISVTTTKYWVHYMPWFATPEIDGFWNHWNRTGSHNTNPEIIDGTGKRQIASYYYPLIGTYSTKDKKVLRYHLLLMKYAGVDGLLIDWYGVSGMYDFSLIKDSTDRIVEVAQEVGLNFAIVYEDWTVTVNGSDQIQNAKNDLLYCQNNYFSLNNYLKIQNKPLLLTFGPRTIKTPSNWTNIFSALSTKPFFMPLIYNKSYCEDASNKNVGAEFQWTDASNSSYSGNISYLKNLYTQYIASAHPGFKDCYNADGSSQYTIVDHQNGIFFKNRLQLAQSYNPPYLQLATWNDFGEGTMIEPTQEFGYKFLETLQESLGLSGNKSVLPEIYRYYNLCKQYNGNIEVESKLNQAFNYFVAMDPNNAIAILNSITLKTEETEATKIKVISDNGILHIRNLLKGSPIVIYDVSGRVVYKTVSAKEEEFVTGLNNGTYFVTTNRGKVKVLINKN